MPTRLKSAFPAGRVRRSSIPTATRMKPFANWMPPWRMPTSKPTGWWPKKKRCRNGAHFWNNYGWPERLQQLANEVQQMQDTLDRIGILLTEIRTERPM